MTPVSGRVAVAAPLDDAFALLQDTTRWPEWYVLHAGWVGDPPANLEIGTRFRSRVVLLGVRDTLRWTVAENRAPTHLSLEGKGTVGFRGRVAFACEADGRSATLVRYEISTKAIGPAIGPLRTLNESGARLLGLDLDYSLRRLDALVAGCDVDAVAAPTSKEIAAASDGGIGPLLKLAGRLR